MSGGGGLPLKTTSPVASSTMMHSPSSDMLGCFSLRPRHSKMSARPGTGELSAMMDRHSLRSTSGSSRTLSSSSPPPPAPLTVRALLSRGAASSCRKNAGSGGASSEVLAATLEFVAAAEPPGPEGGRPLKTIDPVVSSTITHMPSADNCGCSSTRPRHWKTSGLPSTGLLSLKIDCHSCSSLAFLSSSAAAAP